MNHSLLSGDYINDRMDRQSAHLIEQALIDKVADGDKDALATLYQRFSTALFAYLVHMIADRAAAEDLIQEVFLAVWKGAARFRRQASVRTWIYRIAHYQAVSWLRRNVNSPVVRLDEASGALGLEEYAHNNWIRQEVRTALQRLSPDHRAVVQLTFYHGFSYQEISDVLGCPVGTVKSRMSFARRYLTQFLDEAGLSGSDG